MSLISSKAGDHCSYLNPGAVTLDGLPKKGLVALYSLAGQDPTLNPGERWYTPAVNHLLSSEDLTGAPWAETDATPNSATLLTFDAQFGRTKQDITTVAGVSYTLSFTGRRISGNTALRFIHADSASGATTNFTITDTDTDYQITVLGKAGGGLVGFGIGDYNAAGFGQIEVTRWMVAVGTHTAAEMAAMYEQTTDRQSIYDFSGNGNHGIPGGVAAPTTNDPTLSWESRNLLAATKDLTDAAWSDTGSPVKTATTIEDDDAAAFENTAQAATAASGQALTWSLWVLKDAVVPATRFPMFRVTVSGTYEVMLDTSTGASNENAGLSGSHTVTSDGSYWRVEITATADDALGWQAKIFPAVGANADLSTTSTAAVGEIAIQKQQIEVGSAASTFTDPAESGRPVMGFTTDDYVTADSAAASFTGEDRPFSITLLFKPSSLTGNLALASFGSSSSVNPFILLETSGDVPRFKIRDDGSTQITIAASTATVTLEQWVIITLQSTGTVATMYLDGSPVTLDSTDCDVGTLTLDQYAIGALRRTTASQFHEIDGATAPLYSRALSPGEVTQLTNVMAQRAWDYSGIVIPGSSVDYSVPPSQIDEP